MPKGLQRRYGQGHLHFITCSCYRRMPLLGSAGARNLIVNILGEVRDLYVSALFGYVAMPEHVHLLITEPAKGTPSIVMHVLKQRAARDDSDHSTPRFWRFRFQDFNVLSQKKKVEKLQYMHVNPVKRGLVSHPKDWL